MELGGVGDFAGYRYMWINHNNAITATFENGETLRFFDHEDGWSEFVVFGLMTSKQL